MRVIVKDKQAIKDAKILVLPFFESDTKAPLELLLKYGFRKVNHIEAFLEEHKFKGKKGALLYSAGFKTPVDKIIFAGFGKAKDLTIESIRTVFGSLINEAEKVNSKELTFLADVLQAAELDTETLFTTLSEVAYLKTYSFSQYKKEASKAATKISTIHCVSHAVSHSEIRSSFEKGKVVAEGINGIRDYGLEPANHFYPELFANRAKKDAKAVGLSVDVFSKKKIESLKMGGVLGVSKGSHKEPRFVILKHEVKNSPLHICLVGKGVTFDTGGISLKPSSGMEKMKYDMLGAATAIQTTIAIKKLNLPISVTCLTPMVENMPGGNSTNPGDILTMMSGKTVEDLNTDAEGRLILADALHYAKTLKPDYCVDMATLTGAVTVALGNKAIGLMGTDQELVDQLLASGTEVMDRAWQLPLWDEYSEEMKSKIADYKNIGSGKAGTITAGSFLSFFIEGVKWAHLDIAGTAWNDDKRSYLDIGPSGAGLRLLVNWLQKVAKEKSAN